MNMKKWIPSCALLIAAAFAATGCGGGKEASSAPPASGQAAAGGDAKTITIQATNFAFDQPEIRLKKGETVTIELVNKQGLHGIKIDGFDQEIKAGSAVTYIADETGEFPYACSIMCGSGHAEMVGKIIVE